MQNLINQGTSLNTQQASFEYPSPALVYLADKAAKAVQEAPLPTTPGDNSPGAASHAVQGPGYHARQGWFGRTDTNISLCARYNIVTYM